MFRKIAVLVSIFAVFSMSFVAGAQGTATCFIDTDEVVDEGEEFTVTVTCNDATDGVYGFELSTSVSGYLKSRDDEYQPGTFITDAVGGVYSDGLDNETDGLYVISLRDAGDIPTGAFTLGFYEILADKYLSGVNDDDSVTIAISGLKLSTLYGAPITRALEPATVIIRDIDLAYVNGWVTVASDGHVEGLRNLTLTSDEFNPPAFTGDPGDAYEYEILLGPKEVANTDEDNNNDALPLTITMSMVSHLTCTTTLVFDDGENENELGSYTLYAGNVTGGENEINNDDAAAIGAAYGADVFAPAVDINADGKIDIFDLVHVSRNFDKTVDANCGLVNAPA